MRLRRADGGDRAVHDAATDRTSVRQLRGVVQAVRDAGGGGGHGDRVGNWAWVRHGGVEAKRWAPGYGVRVESYGAGVAGPRRSDMPTGQNLGPGPRVIR